MRHEFKDIVRKLSKIYPENEAQSIAFILFEDLFNISKATIFTTDLILNADQQCLLGKLLERLLNYEPIQYVTGQAWFSGLKLKVNPHVLIPRQETEQLVNLLCADNQIERPVILDIGTGSGCIALAIKSIIPDSEVYGTDISTEALKVANENTEINNLNVKFFESNILNRESWPKLNSKPDIVVSNPPYIGLSESELVPKNVKDFEPDLALFVPDSDPLIFYKLIAEYCLIHLKNGGWLYLEINEKYGADLLYMLENKQFTNIELLNDLNGKPRMIKARKLPLNLL